MPKLCHALAYEALERLVGLNLQLFDTVAHETLERLGRFNSHNANTIWACATLKHTVPKLNAWMVAEALDAGSDTVSERMHPVVQGYRLSRVVGTTPCGGVHGSGGNVRDMPPWPWLLNHGHTTAYPVLFVPLVRWYEQNRVEEP